MKEIKQTYTIHAPLERVWQALINPLLIEKWSGDKAVMSDKEGAKFKLWNGDIYGTNTKVVPLKLLEQDWYGGKWDKPSKVSIVLESTPRAIKVSLIHTDIPEKEVEDFAEGWKEYYFGPMKKLLEEG